MKHYEGRLETTRRGGRVVVVRDGPEGEPRRLDPRNDLFNHSPDGFMWGYGGSGPAQLALALCCDLLGRDEAALKVYQAFKWRVVTRWNREQGWTATEAELLAELVELQHAAARGSNT